MAPHRRHIAHAPQQAVGNPGSTAAAARHLKGRGTITVGVVREIGPNRIVAENVALVDTLGVPVVHPVTARVWEFQKRLHVNEAREGYGVLLSDLPPLP